MTAPAPADLPEHSHALPVGARLLEFEIRGVIGIGGFGIVYRAFDHDLEREVAIKEYMPGQFAGRDATGAITVRARTHADTFGVGLRSFVNEARLLARFEHPALLKVYRYWEANGTAYMAMPCYQGRPLGQVLRQLPAPPSQAWLMQLMTPLLGALELLHGQQVYHRDISPDNILVLQDGQPVLLDFGAARRVIGDRTQNLTAILKPNYAPIEQYAEIPGLKQGPWTDLYALGAVIHTCLTGKPPSPAATRAVIDDLVPLDRVGEQLQQRHGLHYDAAFLAAWQATLAVRPDQRVQSVAQLRAALDGTAPVMPAKAAALLPGEEAGRAASDDDDDPDRTIIRPMHQITRPAPVAAPQTAPVRTVPVAAAVPAARGGSMAWIGAGAVVLLLAGGYFFWLRSGPSAPAAAPVAASASAPVAVAPASVAAVPAVVVSPATPEPASASPVPVAPAAPKPVQKSEIRKETTVVEPAPRRSSSSAASSRAALPDAVPQPLPQPVPHEAPTAPAAPAAPATATEACGKRVFIALWTCMREQCTRPAYADKPDCRDYINKQQPGY